MSNIELLQKAREFKKSLPIPQGTENVVWAHGIDIYNTQDPIANLHNILDIINNKMNWELACAKESEVSYNDGDEQQHPLGNFGVFIKGKCTLMAKHDVGSFVHKGERLTYHFNRDTFIEKYSPTRDNQISYSENFVIPTELVGIWVTKKWVNNYLIGLKFIIKNSIDSTKAKYYKSRFKKFAKILIELRKAGTVIYID